MEPDLSGPCPWHSRVHEGRFASYNWGGPDGTRVPACFLSGAGGAKSVAVIRDFETVAHPLIMDSLYPSELCSSENIGPRNHKK